MSHHTPDAPNTRHSGTLSYRDLRGLAEYASSLRGKEFWVGFTDGWTVYENEADLPPGGFVIRVENGPLPYRPKVDFARIGSGGKRVDLLKVKDPVTHKRVEADAVFWSESAVEKFLVPYYASVYGDRADKVVRDLLDVLDSPRRGANGPTTFAIAHIPRSEYVNVDEPTVAVLLEDGTVMRLKEAAALQRGNSGAKSGSLRT